MRAGARYGDYILSAPIGRGGMSEVWRAQHAESRDPVAIKIMRHEMATARARTVFLREADCLAELQSPHAVRVVTAGVGPQDAPFIVTELIEGQDLWSYLEREGPLPWSLVVEIAVQLLDALAEAHSRQIVHRDLKPTNVILQATPGGEVCARLLDFGLAKLIDPFADPAADSLLPELRGSPRYMAPEQIDAGLTSTALDIYGMGALLYCALAGEPPFDGTLEDVLVAHRFELPRTLSDRGVDLPPALDALILRCLHKNPEVRPASAEILAELLDQCRREAPPEALPRIVPPPTAEATPAAATETEPPPDLTLAERPAPRRQTMRPEPPPEPLNAAPRGPKAGLAGLRDRAESFLDEITPAVRWSAAGLFVLLVGLLVWRHVRDEVVEEEPVPEPVAAPITAATPAPVSRRMLRSEAPARRSGLVQLRSGRAITVRQTGGGPVLCESTTVCWVPVEHDVEVRVGRRVLRVITAEALRARRGKTLRLR